MRLSRMLITFVLNVAEMRLLKQTCGVPRMNKTNNEYIGRSMNIEPLRDVEKCYLTMGTLLIEMKAI